MRQDLHLLQDERGSTLPIFALSLAAIIALVGATLALGMDSRAAGNLQATADSAALSGATAFINNASPKAQTRLKDAEARARAIANSNSEYVLTDLNIDAITEDAYGQQTRVNVQMAFEPVNTMAKIAGRNANVKIQREAVAEAVWGFPLCILGLNKTEPALYTDGDVKITAENCVIWSNSPVQNSMDFNGGDVKTKHLCTAGKATIGLGTNLDPKPTEACDPIPDPLADWKPPAHSGFTKVSAPELASSVAGESIPLLNSLAQGLGLSPGSPEIKALKTALQRGEPMPSGPVGGLLTSVQSITEGSLLPSDLGGKKLGDDGIFTNGAAAGMHISEVAQILGIVDNVDPSLYEDDKYSDAATLKLAPGTYNGLDIVYGHVEFTPGVYHIVDAPLTVRRRATLTGKDVTIILHGEGATLSVLDEARLTLTAPPVGRTAGFALAENRYVSIGSASQRSRLTGSGAVNAIGTIYLPRQKLSITGNGAADQASPLLQIVADKIDMADKGALKIVFDTSKTDVPAAIKPQRTARLIQ